MASTIERLKADSTVTMRIPTRTRELIDTAAAVQGKSRTEFMVESARLQALDVLLDQRMFALDAEQTQMLADILASPPKPTAALRDLIRREVPWS